MIKLSQTQETFMNRKTILALALASAFGLSNFAAYADDEKKDEKPQLVAEDEKKDEKPQLIADDEKKDEKPQLVADDEKKDEKPQLVAEGDEKETPKPELIA
jgi:hypothetical protein